MPVGRLFAFNDDVLAAEVLHGRGGPYVVVLTREKKPWSGGSDACADRTKDPRIGADVYATEDGTVTLDSRGSVTRIGWVDSIDEAAHTVFVGRMDTAPMPFGYPASDKSFALFAPCQCSESRQGGETYMVRYGETLRIEDPKGGGEAHRRHGPCLGYDTVGTMRERASVCSNGGHDFGLRDQNCRRCGVAYYAHEHTDCTPR